MSPAAGNPTRWWWIRHAPIIAEPGTIHGHDEVSADVSNEALIAAQAARLPDGAVWLMSDLRRTRQTTEALCRQRPEKVDIIATAELREQSFGDWEGGKWSDNFGAQSAEFWQNYAANCPPGGESFIALNRRIAATIEAANERYAGRDIVAIAHNGVILSALALALDLKPSAALSFWIDNLSLTRIDARWFDGLRFWRVQGVNSMPSRDGY